LQRDPKVLRRNRLLVFTGSLLLAATLYFFLSQGYEGFVEKKRWQQAEDFVSRGEYSAAREILEKPWISRQYRPDALYLKGRLEEFHLGLPRAALISYLTLVRDYPSLPLSIEARRRIVSLYRERLLDPVQAVMHLRELILAAPGNPDDSYQLADAYFRMGEYALASRQFSQLHQSLEPGVFERDLRYRLASSLHLEGNPSEAETLLAALLEESSEDGVALEAVLILSQIAEDRNLLDVALKKLDGYLGQDSQGRLAERRALLKRLIQKKGNAL